MFGVVFFFFWVPFFEIFFKIIHLIMPQFGVLTIVGLAYRGKDIVFGFIIEYSSLRDFGP
jgi:hypothetical protein